MYVSDVGVDVVWMVVIANPWKLISRLKRISVGSGSVSKRLVRFFMRLTCARLCRSFQVEGFEKGSKNILICATNRKDDLDSALIR